MYVHSAHNPAVHLGPSVLEVVAAFLPSASRLQPPHLRNHRVTRIYCQTPPGPVYAGCLQLLEKETLWDLVFPHSVPSFWEKHR